MTLVEFKKRVDGIKFHPLFTFRVEEDYFAGPSARLVIEQACLDSRYSHDSIRRDIEEQKRIGHEGFRVIVELGFVSTVHRIDSHLLNLFHDEAFFKHWLYERLVIFARHEIEEFLFFDGIQYRDPHKNDNPHKDPCDV